MVEMKEEISVKGTVDFLKKAIALLSKYKWFIIIAMLVGAAIGLIRAYISKPQYSAETSFIMDGGQGGGKASMLMGLATQFGFGGGMTGMTEDKLLFIARSNSVVSSALLKQNVIEGKKDFNINHFIRLQIQNIDEDKKQKVVFFQHENQEQRTIKEDSLLNACTKLFAEQLFMITKNKEGVISVKLNLAHEHLAKQLIDDLSSSIITFFNDQTINKKANSFNLIKKTSDSLYDALLQKENQLASYMDGTQRMIKMKGRVPELELQREVKILNTLYAESLKNLELVRFEMLYNTPAIQIIDRPHFPLVKVKKSKLMAVIGGIFIGGLLASLLVMAKQFYKKYWKGETAKI